MIKNELEQESKNLGKNWCSNEIVAHKILIFDWVFYIGNFPAITPARTHSICGLKSRALKLTFLA